MKTARETYLGWKDSTDGALHLNALVDPGQYNWKPRGMTGTGKRIKTHSGPYNNSYTQGGIRRRRSYGLILFRTKQRPANLLLQNDILRGFDAAELHLPPTLRRKRTDFQISEDAMAVD
jgi:hypothetical protein